MILSFGKQVAEMRTKDLFSLFYLRRCLSSRYCILQRSQSGAALRGFESRHSMRRYAKILAEPSVAEILALFWKISSGKKMPLLSFICKVSFFSSLQHDQLCLSLFLSHHRLSFIEELQYSRVQWGNILFGLFRKPATREKREEWNVPRM